jgi:hypothetical protein
LIPYLSRRVHSVKKAATYELGILSLAEFECQAVELVVTARK